MARVANIGTQVRTSAEELVEVFAEIMEDGEVSPNENDLFLDKLDGHCLLAGDVEASTQVIACVVSSGTKSRRAKQRIKDWQGLHLIHGGLHEQLDPGAA